MIKFIALFEEIEIYMKMLYSTVELIAQASTNYHILFCFCNVIIIFILGSSRLSSDDHVNVTSFADVKIKNDATKDLDSKKDFIISEEEEVTESTKEEEDEENEGPGRNGMDENDQVRIQENKSLEDEEEGDELRRKIEEFIGKVKGQLIIMDDD
ncbi:protein FYV8-like [Amaranthus tricolor]|uniref:protein FYV8-like n=1 Tax=Amaranthus tricolor TaxID=29722 RepID=UPI00258A1552|nr:protein FYV8-like [Amaranthus tricolor]